MFISQKGKGVIHTSIYFWPRCARVCERSQFASKRSFPTVFRLDHDANTTAGACLPFAPLPAYRGQGTEFSVVLNRSFGNAHAEAAAPKCQCVWPAPLPPPFQFPTWRPPHQPSSPALTILSLSCERHLPSPYCQHTDLTQSTNVETKTKALPWPKFYALS